VAGETGAGHLEGEGEVGAAGAAAVGVVVGVEVGVVVGVVAEAAAEGVAVGEAGASVSHLLHQLMRAIQGHRAFCMSCHELVTWICSTGTHFMYALTTHVAATHNC